MSSSISSKIHEVTVGKLTFSSDFDSGNTCAVDYDAASNTYNLWMAHDCDGTQYESHFKAWFYFGVRGFTADQKVTFAINNMGKQRQLFNVHKLRPVTRTIPDDPQWKRIEGRTILLRQGSKKDRNYELRWSYKSKYSSEATVYFAMCYPFGYDDLQLYLEQLESICRGRVDLLTLTSTADKITSEQESSSSSSKPIILLTARVHPGETPGQFAMIGALNFALSDDPRAAALRSHYDLKFVPMINPDGVHMGNYRTNSRGINLNRFYSDPGPDHEAVTAIVELAEEYAQRDLLHLYVDLHAHANKTGCFLFGNALKSPIHNAWNTAFARVMAINSPYFDLNKCNFSAKNMSKRDKRISRESSYGAALGNLTGDGEQSNEVAHSENNEDDEGGDHAAAAVPSKEGCGRVAIHKLTGITHSYTLECSYARPTHVSSLDLFHHNCWTRVSNTPHITVANILRGMIPRTVDVTDVAGPVEVSPGITLKQLPSLEDVDGYARPTSNCCCRSLKASTASLEQITQAREPIVRQYPKPGCFVGKMYKPPEHLR
ncbi:hypothetical protein FOZ63_022030 [Perkinsus olseni]|uniref:Peptidase M14 domain-containing protein n=1 Tax=Perkinsus olseni TaxID=32597 RepID=A0A7J6PT58_PEROL|nr:hypothetical protein FOZ63_022030 [Perkinsus olseni]